MKKLLQLSLLLVGVSSFAQDGLSCANAIPVNAGSTTLCPQITGTYIGTCLPAASTSQGGSANPKSMWYSYTATSNGEVTVSSNLAQNDGVTNSNDTRLSILSGTCTTLSCYDSNDDVSAANYLSTITFPVASGTTYYIMWDSGWSDKPFDFTVNFDGLSCVRPTSFDMLAPSNITENSITLSWNPAIGSPAAYNVEYGNIGFTQGTGTTVSTSSTSVNLAPLTNGGNYDFYYRSACSSVSKSAWVGPYNFYLAKALPYSNGFEAPNYEDGFVGSGWTFAQSTTIAQAGEIFSYTFSSATAATNTGLYSRAFSLKANEQVTLTFYTRAFVNSGTPTNHTLKVWVNGSQSITGATQLGTDITVSGTTYTMQTRTFTATTAGTYYFIFNDVTPQVAAASALLLDTVNLTSVLKVNDYLTSKFLVYPNPVNNVINFSNDVNALIDTIDLTDLNGRVIKTVKVDAAQGQISVSDLSSGIYMMRISTDQGLAVKKIVKE